LVTDGRESGGVSMEDVVVPMATIALASSNEISNCQLVYSCWWCHLANEAWL